MEKKIQKFKREKAMSLIELMLVMTLVLGAMVGLFQLYKTIKANQKKSATKTFIAQIQNGVEQFKNDIGRFPTKLEELVVPPSDQNEKRRWNSDGYADKKSLDEGSIKDDYGNELEYRFDKAKNSFEIFSWGEKGVGSETGQIFAE
jgi:type II secretory pathway pseudopilin PulG